MSDVRLLPDFLSKCRLIGTSTWSDALDALGVPGVCDGLSTRSGTERIAGQAVTIEETAQASPILPLSEFRIGELIEAAGPGQVLVISIAGPTVSTAGGLAARDAALRGVAGFVIDGACRDITDIRATGLFVASRAVTPRSGKGRIRLESINEPITCGGVTVKGGDLVVADETGVVFVPLELAQDALEIAERLAEVDNEITAGLDKGGGFAALLERVGPA
jgi:3-hexulose-6-phosphate synthase/6-phospho-3-hexuloisomerase